MISDIDLSKGLSDEVVAAIRRAWLEHLVIFFNDQNLTRAQFLAFARRFGEVIEYPFVKGLDATPDKRPRVYEPTWCEVGSPVGWSETPSKSGCRMDREG